MDTNINKDSPLFIVGNMFPKICTKVIIKMLNSNFLCYEIAGMVLKARKYLISLITSHL